MRKTIREALRRHGEPAGLYFRQRRIRLRPLILILDISGSMADYSRHLLQFAHSARQAAGLLGRQDAGSLQPVQKGVCRQQGVGRPAQLAVRGRQPGTQRGQRFAHIVHSVRRAV